MKKEDIFNELITEVCDICSVSTDALFGTTKLQMVVDARMLGVQYLRRIGLSNEEIALFVERNRMGDPTYIPQPVSLKQKAKGIRRLFESYSQRCLESYAFCLMSQDLTEFCRERYSSSYLSWMKPLPKK